MCLYKTFAKYKKDIDSNFACHIFQRFAEAWKYTNFFVHGVFMIPCNLEVLLRHNFKQWEKQYVYNAFGYFFIIWSWIILAASSYPCPRSYSKWNSNAVMLLISGLINSDLTVLLIGTNCIKFSLIMNFFFYFFQMSYT